MNETERNLKNADAIDYAELLGKYVRHVKQCEGCSFIDRLNESAYVSEVRFSPEEVRVLEELDKLPTWPTANGAA